MRRRWRRREGRGMIGREGEGVQRGEDEAGWRMSKKRDGGGS